MLGLVCSPVDHLGSLATCQITPWSGFCGARAILAGGDAYYITVVVIRRTPNRLRPRLTTTTIAETACLAMAKARGGEGGGGKRTPSTANRFTLKTHCAFGCLAWPPLSSLGARRGATLRPDRCDPNANRGTASPHAATILVREER